MKFSVVSVITLATLALSAPLQSNDGQVDVATVDDITTFTHDPSLFDETDEDVVLDHETDLVTRDAVGKGTGPAGAILDVASKTNAYIQTLVNKDLARRQAFTQNMVASTRRINPNHSVVVVNVGYNFQGNMITRQTVWCKTKLGKDVSYDVIVWDRGTFTLRGDGGFENWAFQLNRGCTRNGGQLKC